MLEHHPLGIPLPEVVALLQSPRLLEQVLVGVQRDKPASPTLVPDAFGVPRAGPTDLLVKGEALHLVLNSARFHPGLRVMPGLMTLGTAHAISRQVNLKIVLAEGT